MSTIWILAGANGSGKSSIGGSMLRESGGDYFNPDEAAAVIRQRRSRMTQARANEQAWRLGLHQLEACIKDGRDYFFETTLGGRTITARLSVALAAGIDVRMWYVGLDQVERNVARVAARVSRGGHAISEQDIRLRFDSSRRNLATLVPRLTELKVFDNSVEADPALGHTPEPTLVLHTREGRILGPKDLRETPEWAKPIVARALKHDATLRTRAAPSRTRNEREEP